MRPYIERREEIRNDHRRAETLDEPANTGKEDEEFTRRRIWPQIVLEAIARTTKRL